MSQILLSLMVSVSLSCWISKIQAQFPAFPDSNAVWRIDEFNGPNFLASYSYHLKLADHDTLINGEWYNCLWHGEEGQGGSFAGGIKVDVNERVYYYHPNTDSTYLLYDFAPSIGDSMEVWIGGTEVSFPATQMIYINDIEVIVNAVGTAYRRIGVLNWSATIGGQGVTNWWTQGIGGTGGLLSTSGSGSVSIYGVLGCMQHNDTLWPAGEPGFCSPLGIPERSRSGLNVHPNPSSGQFTLVGGTDIEQVLVFDPQGREVLRTRNITLDLSAYPTGLYTAVVSTAQGRRSVRLVVLR